MNTSLSRRWLKGSPFLVSFIIVLLLIASAVIPNYNQIVTWLFVEFEVPRLERELGFESAMVEVAKGEMSFRVFKLTRVDPQGRLGRVGVNSGDIPVGYHHGIMDFLYSLEDLREGRETELQVVAEGRIFEGGSAWRRIHVPSQPVR